MTRTSAMTMTFWRSNLCCAFATVAALLPATTAWAAGPRPFFQMPVPCGQTWAASTYAGHWNGDEDAIDLAQWDGTGTNISEGEFAVASAAGTVLEVTTTGGAHKVVLDHGGGWLSNYWHLESEPPLTIGQRVAQGQVVGRISNSGTVDMHLHHTQLDGVDASPVYFNGQPIDTNQGDPNSWGKFGTEDAETLTSLNCPQNSFLSFNMNGMRYQLLYKPGSGATKVVRLNSDGLGVTTVWSDNWGQQWTHLVPFTLWGGQQHLFRYKASTGQVYFDRINSQGEGTTTLTSSNWWAGWTHFMPFALGGKPYFIAYDSLNGYANIDRINVEGSGSTKIYGSTWSKGWTHFVPYVMGGVQYVLLYKSGTGQVEVDTITGSGSNVVLTEVWADTWSTDWSHLMPVMHKGTMRLFAYRSTTGQVSYGTFKANGQGVQHLASAMWSTHWTSFTPFRLPGGDGGLLGYQGGTGTVQTRQLLPDGSGSSAIWSGDWTTGWR